MKHGEFSPVSKDECFKIMSYKAKGSTYLQELFCNVSTFSSDRFPCDFCCETCVSLTNLLFTGLGTPKLKHTSQGKYMWNRSKANSTTVSSFSGLPGKFRVIISGEILVPLTQMKTLLLPFMSLEVHLGILQCMQVPMKSQSSCSRWGSAISSVSPLIMIPLLTLKSIHSATVFRLLV